LIDAQAPHNEHCPDSLSPQTKKRMCAALKPALTAMPLSLARANGHCLLVVVSHSFHSVFGIGVAGLLGVGILLLMVSNDGKDCF